VFDLLPGNRHAGLVGLGVGTLAVYGRPGDTLRFYDINPAVEPVAREHFSYLDRSTADVKVILGDARLVLEDELARQGSQQFDLLVLDAFSSDAIPIHLLTREAMAVYLAHLKPNGVIAVHISNSHLKLGPVVEGLARHYGMIAATIADDPPNEDWWVYPTTWVLLTRNFAILSDPSIADVTSAREPEPVIVDWTDDHASLFGILK
jgi:spermidine synthase